MSSLIVATSDNNTIGRSNNLPWYLSADLKHFRELTAQHVVVMGRNTYTSIYNRLKGPLPNRRNIVISQSLDTVPQGFELFPSVESVLQSPGINTADVFYIGGAKLYAYVLQHNLVDTMYVTEIRANIEGDTYFPSYDSRDWKEVSRDEHTKDEKNEYDFSFVKLVKNDDKVQ